MASGKSRNLPVRFHCCSILPAVIVLMVSAAAPGDEQRSTRPAGAAATQPATAPTTRPAIVDFQPGIRIDWNKRQVLVEGEIVLRQGALELFACSPQTREHESIVCVQARPLHVYQALGLIGLEPGEPSYYTDDMQTYHPATGDPVEMEVRYAKDGRTVEHPIEAWMRNARNGETLKRQPWVFAGSFVMDETFAADPEGTVVAVVDFPSAIVALPKYHSASNDALWLEPDTEKIPPVGSDCTLVFRAGKILIQIDRRGRYLLQGQPARFDKIVAGLKKHAADAYAKPVRLEIHPDAPDSRVHALRDVIDLLDVPIDDFTSSSDEDIETEHEAALLIPWMKTLLDRTHASSQSPVSRPATEVDGVAPLIEIQWFEKTGQVVRATLEDVRRRYWPYPAVNLPEEIPASSSDSQGD